METTILELKLSTQSKLSPEAAALIRTLLYFDIFHYPLTLEELVDCCQEQQIQLEKASELLQTMFNKKLINKLGNFYFVSADTSIVARRISGNAEAEKKIKVARNMSDFISKFPFVEAVCISGSLSKNYMDKDSDIDFFIITSPHRLWICRGLLVLFKKMVLLNSRKHFCINYYLDSNNLEIPDQNIFTATEIVFLKPTFNTLLFNQFKEANNWCNAYYPNKQKATQAASPVKSVLIKVWLEKLLSGKWGELLDSYFFKLTLKRWKKKFPHFNEAEFDLNLRSKKNVSKHHPRGYQKRVLDSHQSKITDFEKQFNVKLR